MGNRGILHDGRRHIIRPWQVRRWIACRLEFRGRHRLVMQPHRYTELFFLDEATAFAAGHRPCAECRYADYQRFRSLWAACHGESASADVMDEQLHRDRLTDRRVKRVYSANLDALPDGAYISMNDRAWLVWGDELLAWSEIGYLKKRPRPQSLDVEVLTPRSTVAVLAAGYPVEIHPTARAASPEAPPSPT